jgi:hypothetical protein
MNVPSRTPRDTAVDPIKLKVPVFGNLTNDHDVWLIDKRFDDHFAHHRIMPEASAG